MRATCLDVSIITASTKASSGCGERPVIEEEDILVAMCVCIWIAVRYIMRLGEHY